MFHRSMRKKRKKGAKKREMPDLEKMHERDLYPVMEKFLKTQKNCLSEYVGSELSLKRGKNNNMLELHKKYLDARMERDRELYEQQIKIDC